MTTTQQLTETHETYRNGLVRPVAMKNLPDWALAEFLGRHSGPALEAARDEFSHRAAAKQEEAAAEYGRLAQGC